MSDRVTERVQQAFARIAETDRPEIWITLRPEADVLAEAAALDERVAAGESLPCAGLVVAVKDNIDVAGLPTTAGHPAFAHRAETSASAVQRLIDAGAIVLGKTNLDQFATGLVGTRSPYGAVRNSRFPDRISGGSSSGSAVAVALGIVDAALGTDTAGSGRVPAALNGIVGIKTTLGIVPVDGVVPACRSYDAVTVFARTLAVATEVTAVIAGSSRLDPASREWPADVVLAAPAQPRIAVPRPEFLESLSSERRALFSAAVARLRDRGATTEEIDLGPFLECAKLLYEGALVAERYAAYGAFMAAHPEGADPTVALIVAAAEGRRGPDLVADQERVARYRLQAAALLEGFDALLVPTTPEHPTLAEVAADPVAVNSRLGTFTNFMNLLDLAGVAVPAGETHDGLFGVTVVVRAFADQVAIDVAALLVDETPLVLPTGGIELAVFGAHLSGQPLNHQLVSAGARLLTAVQTSDAYRMHALPGPTPKPGVVRVEQGAGRSLAGEAWLVPPAALGRFLAALPQPMTLGRIELADHREVLGFGCSWAQGPDITEFGGWLSYLDAPSQPITG
ncbi:MAG: allophanate hydrolase [Herbiconiux sp.]|uniref:allophanate hydrolase n=1 Tax=Herbiconiux sp. TaxID=1871186 RepID=UPI001221F4D7|nr:allophanate hydrolase [Herbiconiux sp.]TAJ48102.1 MAG: allophanate hydrolase [Herbiconiux sp.]